MYSYIPNNKCKINDGITKWPLDYHNKNFSGNIIFR